MSDTDWDVDFFFDPVCPFAWQTSRWLRRVAELRTLNVNWRFICLRIINEDRDYAAEFPPNYEEAHGRGRSLLRVCAAVREAIGPEPIGAMYEAFGNELWSRRPSETSFSGVMAALSNEVDVEGILIGLGLDPALAAAADDGSWDDVLRSETALAFSRTGPDVGTPILTFGPPDGNSFFGPVISTIPSDDEALALYDAVATLASMSTFSELKRTKRPPLDLPLLDF